MPSNRLLVGRSAFNEGLRSNRLSLVSLLVGLVVGFCMALLFNLSGSEKPDWVQKIDPHNMELIDAPSPELDFGSPEHTRDNTSIADMLYNETRVLCWIMTSPSNHQTKARHVKRTWGKRCNKLLFMSSEEDVTLDTIALNVSEGRDNLWAKTKEAFKYIYHKHLDDYDWFLKADDDTYIIAENLRYMLHSYSPETPIYFGCKFKPTVKQGYLSGGAGYYYVISRAALRLFVEKALPNKKICRQDGAGAEDVEMGKCLKGVKVISGDSRDENGRGRFLPFPPEKHLIPDHSDNKIWFWQYMHTKTDEGLDCCSDHAIGFHYICPTKMYVLDYIIYHLRPYGIRSTAENLPESLKIGKVLPSSIQSNETTAKSKK